MERELLLAHISNSSVLAPATFWSHDHQDYTFDGHAARGEKKNCKLINESSPIVTLYFFRKAFQQWRGGNDIQNCFFGNM